jgi:hypothetical protein
MADESPIARRQRQAIEIMAEDERLRSALTDDEARVLLEWANGEVKTAASQAGAGKSAGTRFDADVRRIGSVTKAINDLVGDRGTLNESELAQRVTNVMASWAGKQPAAVSLDKGVVAYLKSSPDNQAFIRRLTEMLGSETDDRSPSSRGQPAWLLLAVAAGLLVLCVLAIAVYLLMRGGAAADTMPTPTAIVTLPPGPAAAFTSALPAFGARTADTAAAAQVLRAGETDAPGNQIRPYLVYFAAPIYPDRVANHTG